MCRLSHLIGLYLSDFTHEASFLVGANTFSKRAPNARRTTAHRTRGTQTGAIKEGIEKYAKFSGRSSRRAYWFFYLFCLILTFVTAPLSAGLYSAVQIALLLPSIAFACRRLHDSDKSGWFILVPIYNLVLLCTAGDPHDNRYGSKVR